MACEAGGDHFEHIWLVEEREQHRPEDDCQCTPELLCDDDGFYFLHHSLEV